MTPAAPAAAPPAKPDRDVFNFNRAQVVDENFVAFVKSWQGPAAGALEPADPVRPGYRLTGRDLIELFESQVLTRHQDIESREMRARNEGFYTISSTGHEGNAAVGRATRHTDMAFLHYRSGGFMAERARQVPSIDFVRDTMLSFAASADDPISGGRHKVWGSRPLWVPPQTSTIASHLPKAVGAAIALRRAKRLGLMQELPDDAIVVCTFGDASLNHAVAQTAFNSAGWSVVQDIPVPILFVCEDNGIGISTPTPTGWVEASMSARPGIAYLAASGIDVVEAYEAAVNAVAYVRQRRRPAFLHLKVVRLLGHAGSDAETEYRTHDQIRASEAEDPLIVTARMLLETGLMTPDSMLALYEGARSRVKAASTEAVRTPKLTSAADVIAPLAPHTPDRVRAEASKPPSPESRAKLWGGAEKLPESQGPTHMAVNINRALADLLAKYPESILFGEDVAKKGGVYRVTTGLQAKFGARVFDTLLDETTILGMALGASHMGLLPMPEIQYLAYYHNAEDQIRGEACSLQFFSKDQFRNPALIRIQGWAYQKGFGGHFHNDNSIAALRDVPGLVIATPSRGDDAVGMLRTLAAMARVDGRICVVIEPIALYMTKDLHESKDGLWQFPYPAPDHAVPFGEGRVYDDAASDLTIITFANGVYMSLRAAKELREKHGIQSRVVDLRWLNPLNEEFIAAQAAKTGRVLVMDEGRRTGGLSEAIMAIIAERCGYSVKARRMNALDTYIPLGVAANLVIPTEPDIVREAIATVRG